MPPVKNPLIRDSFKMNENAIPFKILEEKYNEDGTVAQSETGDKTVDGKNIIARVQGQFFITDGTSLNNRFYSRKLWENTLIECEHRLGQQMIGVLGHEQEINEGAIADGKVTHVVTKLWIDENGNGMGEACIFGTEAGKNLNMLLRAGIRVPVSSRAYGKTNGTTKDGAAIIDESNFYLQGFDFVLHPGVDAAYPKVVESLHNKQSEGTGMELEPLVKLNERLGEEKAGLKVELTEALSQNKKLEENQGKLVRRIRLYEAAVGSTDQVKLLVEGLRKWLVLPPMSTWAAQMGLLAQSGNTPEQLIKIGEGLVEYVQTGKSPAQIKADDAELAAYRKLGKEEDLKKVMEACNKYATHGTPKQVDEKLAKAVKIEENVRKLDREIAAKKISRYFIGKGLEHVTEAEVGLMLTKFTKKEVVGHYKKLLEANETSNRFRNREGEKINEGAKPARVIKHSGRVGGFFESIK